MAWAESQLEALNQAIEAVMRASSNTQQGLASGPGGAGEPEGLKGRWKEVGLGVGYDDADVIGSGSLQTYVYRGRYRATDRPGSERPAAIKVTPCPYLFPFHPIYAIITDTLSYMCGFTCGTTPVDDTLCEGS